MKNEWDLKDTIYINLDEKKVFDQNGVEFDTTDAKFIMIKGDDIVIRTTSGPIQTSENNG